jgi:hypothetical protein
MQPAGEVLLLFAAGLEHFRSRVLDAAIQQQVDEVRLSFTTLMLGVWSLTANVGVLYASSVCFSRFVLWVESAASCVPVAGVC